MDGEYPLAQAFIVMWIMMPAYLANTIAVVTGGRFPIDQGKKLGDGNRILGDGKTWSGLLGGTLGGITIGYLQLNFGNSIIEGIAGINRNLLGRYTLSNFLSFGLWSIIWGFDCIVL